MNDQEREELLSAYIDGELSADERARVEGWLAESAELRQLRDELMAVRASIRSLPRHAIRADLATEIVSRAQRESEPRIEPVSLAREWWSRGGARRWMWPAVAIAAALVIWALGPEQPAERQVARAPKGPHAISAPPGEQLAEKSKQDAAPAIAGGVATKATPQEGEMLGSQRAEPKMAARRMLAAPAENAAGAPPAAAAPSSGRYHLRPQVASQRSDLYLALAAPAIVCDVTESFFRDRQFEKILERHQIAPLKTDQNRPSPTLTPEPLARRGKSAEEATDKKESDDGNQREYIVEATDAEIEAIVADLNKRTVDVQKVARPAAAEAAVAKSSAPQEAVARDEARKDAEQERHSVVFRLRVVDPPESSPSEPR